MCALSRAVKEYLAMIASESIRRASFCLSVALLLAVNSSTGLCQTGFVPVPSHPTGVRHEPVPERTPSLFASGPVRSVIQQTAYVPAAQLEFDATPPITEVPVAEPPAAVPANRRDFPESVRVHRASICLLAAPGELG